MSAQVKDDSEVLARLDSVNWDALLDDSLPASELRTVWDTLVATRNTRHLTQAYVASKMFVSRPAVSQMESRGGIPSLPMMNAYAEALGMELRITLRTKEHHA